MKRNAEKFQFYAGGSPNKGEHKKDKTQKGFLICGIRCGHYQDYVRTLVTYGINATCDNKADYSKYCYNQFTTLIEGLNNDDDDTAKLFEEVQNAVKYTREGGSDSEMQKFKTTRTAADNVKTNLNRKKIKRTSENAEYPP